MLGAQGRPPTPRPINEMRGNPGRRPINHDEPKARRIVPPGVKPVSDDEISARRFHPPPHLDAEAVAEWKRLVPVLAHMKLLTEADRPVLANICTLWATIVDASKQLKAEGLTQTSEHGAVSQHPLFQIQRGAIDLHGKLVAQFGMAPASRSRLVIDKDGKQHKSGLLNGQWHQTG
jgi:P27 family predicted phage terminase small subunit